MSNGCQRKTKAVNLNTLVRPNAGVKRTTEVDEAIITQHGAMSRNQLKHIVSKCNVQCVDVSKYGLLITYGEQCILLCHTQCFFSDCIYILRQNSTDLISHLNIVIRQGNKTSVFMH